MKILLSAFACAPNVGSEGGVGWRWALELAKAHDVTVVTDVTRREAIECELAAHPVANLRIVYFRPRALARVPLNSTTAQVLYTAWQFALLPFARSLHKSAGFEVAIHISYGVFRHPSFLGWLGIPFIFGPLGGGEDAPLRLKRSIKGREKLKEILRAAINRAALFDPFLWLAYARATLILVKTEDTRGALPWPFRKRAIVYPEIGFDAGETVTPPVRNPGEPLRVLFAGRLLGWKGAHLAIRAVALARRRGLEVEFCLVGQGPYEAELRQVARSLGEHDRIRWIAQMPQQELFALYQSMHCFLFPSLHDSSGNVVVEAQAKGLPVICLDIGGPATLVTPKTALIVNTRGLDEAALVERLADALERIAGDEASRREMGSRAAVRISETMRWQDRVSGALCLLDKTHQYAGRRP